MSKRIVGLSGWIRDINNTWAEQFDVRYLTMAGRCLVALSSGEKKTAVLISQNDVDSAMSKKERSPHEDAEARAGVVLNMILQGLPDCMKAQNRVEFIRLEDLLVEAVDKFCWLNPYPTWEELAASRGGKKIEAFEIEE